MNTLFPREFINSSSILSPSFLASILRKRKLVPRETNRLTAFLESRRTKKRKETRPPPVPNLIPSSSLKRRHSTLRNRKYTKPIPSPLYRWSAIAKRSRIDTASSRPSGTGTKKKKSRALGQRRGKSKTRRIRFYSAIRAQHTTSTRAPFLEPGLVVVSRSRSGGSTPIRISFQRYRIRFVKPALSAILSPSIFHSVLNFKGWRSSDLQYGIELEGTIDHAATFPGSRDDFVIPRMTRSNAVMRVPKWVYALYIRVVRKI